MNNFIKIGENRFIEDHGLAYEDFVVGHLFEHRPGRSITASDNTWASLIALNQHPIHIDANYAATTEFKQILVSSLVTFAIINGMTVNTISAKAIANLGWNNVRLLYPVFINDTLYAETTILHKRESKSRPGQGIVTVETNGYNQNKQKVISFERVFLVATKQLSLKSNATLKNC